MFTASVSLRPLGEVVFFNETFTNETRTSVLEIGQTV